ncbi:MAG: DUF111 family protein, partial [Flavobacteriales bacterium]|nr:DUF111 family protein [Flavobacteriales bacterium]
MNYFFITGSSKGLGKALTELLLENENNTVYGMARSSSISHKRYFHTVIDLSKLDNVVSYPFPTLENVEKIVDTLVLETGTLGVRISESNRFIIPRTIHNVSVTLNGNSFEVNYK